MAKALDLIGRTFGRLTVAAREPNDAKDDTRWRCECDCGGVKVVIGWRLTNPRRPTLSCGCLQKEVAARSGRANATHGYSRTTSEYRTWTAMMTRTTNPNHVYFCRYGGRGISVCERWQSFANFLADMGPKPTPAHTIERVNNDGNYEPGNCRWATRRDQSRNSSGNAVVRFRGRDILQADVVRESGFTWASIRHRVAKFGETVDQAVAHLDTSTRTGKARAAKKAA